MVARGQWPCYKCELVFSTTHAMIQHLHSHLPQGLDQSCRTVVSKYGGAQEVAQIHRDKRGNVTSLLKDKSLLDRSETNQVIPVLCEKSHVSEQSQPEMSNDRSYGHRLFNANANNSLPGGAASNLEAGNGVLSVNLDGVDQQTAARCMLCGLDVAVHFVRLHTTSYCIMKSHRQCTDCGHMYVGDIHELCRRRRDGEQDSEKRLESTDEHTKDLSITVEIKKKKACHKKETLAYDVRPRRKSYSCSHCEKKNLPSEISLKHHIKVSHSSKLVRTTSTEKSDQKSVPMQHPCAVCGKRFSSSHSMTRHVQLIHENLQKYTCEKCGTSFKYSRQLLRHGCINRPMPPKPETEYTPCSECSMKVKGNLGCHMWVAHGVDISGRRTLFKCDICGLRVGSKTNLVSHRNTHTGERTFKCDICDATFKQRATLTKHKALHTGVKEFRCKVCFRSFARKSYLEQHMRIHTGDKPYVCHVCNNSFIQKTSLNVHMKSQHNLVKQRSNGPRKLPRVQPIEELNSEDRESCRLQHGDFRGLDSKKTDVVESNTGSVIGQGLLYPTEAQQSLENYNTTGGDTVQSEVSAVESMATPKLVHVQLFEQSPISSAKEIDAANILCNLESNAYQTTKAPLTNSTTLLPSESVQTFIPNQMYYINPADISGTCYKPQAETSMSSSTALNTLLPSLGSSIFSLLPAETGGTQQQQHQMLHNQPQTHMMPQSTSQLHMVASHAPSQLPVLVSQAISQASSLPSLVSEAPLMHMITCSAGSVPLLDAVPVVSLPTSSVPVVCATQTATVTGSSLSTLTVAGLLSTRTRSNNAANSNKFL